MKWSNRERQNNAKLFFKNVEYILTNTVTINARDGQDRKHSSVM